MVATVLPPHQGAKSRLDITWDEENVSVLLNFVRLITTEVVDRKKTKKKNRLEVVSSIEQIHSHTKLS